MNIHTLYALCGRRFRKRRMTKFYQALKPTESSTILDIGGYPGTWTRFPTKPLVTILNIRPVEFTQTEDYPWIDTVVGDGCKLNYPAGSFDIVFSNSVIEHVGSFERQQAFAREAHRVGRSLWIQTPAREFFMEPHLLTPFIHFLPISIQRKFIRRFTLWGVLTKPTAMDIQRFLEEVRLLTYREMKQLFPDSNIYRETVCGFTKSYVAVRKCGTYEAGLVSARGRNLASLQSEGAAPIRRDRSIAETKCE
jgi:SAM-dependent methyltransferase